MVKDTEILKDMPMKKNDCFLMKGSNENEPMTLYYITDMYDDKIRARSICIKDEMVQGLENDDEYDYEIPEDAIMLPSNTYDEIKHGMNTFLKEAKSFIEKNLIEGKPRLQIGGHYYDGYIHTITEIGEKRTKYNLFRLEPENISPIWTGECLVETLVRRSMSISDETYNQVLNMYKNFLFKLRSEILTLC